MSHEITQLWQARKGHFLLESGYHGELWLDLELLCYQPEAVRKFAIQLASRLAPYQVEAICGPLIEGAFIALMVASHLDLPFAYAERSLRPAGHGLFPYHYQVPNALRPRLRGRRIAVVNDVISAGSAVRGTLNDLEQLGAQPVALATLVSLGPSASALAKARDLAFETLLTLPYTLWTREECPMCARQQSLSDPSLGN